MVVAVLGLVVIGAFLFLSRTRTDFFQDIQRQIETRGFALSHTRQRHRGPVTWVWGRYRQPIPFYLHFSNRDPLAAMAGQLGIADINIGHAVFDAAFYIRSNESEWAKQFMAPELCERLLRFESVEFITSSIGNLLSPEYWPDERERNLRDVWMLRTDGKLNETDAAAHIALAQELSAKVLQVCQNQFRTLDSCRSPLFEGR